MRAWRWRLVAECKLRRRSVELRKKIVTLTIPRLVANDQQQAVWRWDQQEPFGVNVPNENPVSTTRVMNPHAAERSESLLSQGYVKYENAAVPKPQGVDPYTGKTLPNSRSHFPIN